MKVPNQYRVRSGFLASTDADGNNGVFKIPYKNYLIQTVVSDGMGWEHVSVSLPKRAPYWSEMNYIKELFWDPEEWVVQFHPAKSQYVNNHEFCLHLWRPTNENLPVPPSILVGVK